MLDSEEKSLIERAFGSQLPCGYAEGCFMLSVPIGTLAKAVVYGRDFAANAAHCIDQPLDLAGHTSVFQGLDQVLDAFYRVCPKDLSLGRKVFEATRQILAIADNRVELAQNEDAEVLLSGTPIRQLHRVFCDDTSWDKEAWLGQLRDVGFLQRLEAFYRLVEEEESARPANPLSLVTPPTEASRRIVLRQLFRDWDDRNDTARSWDDDQDLPFHQERFDTVAVLAQRGTFGQEMIRAGLSHDHVPPRTKLLLASALAGFPYPARHDADLIAGVRIFAQSSYEMGMVTDALTALDTAYKNLS